MPNFQEDPQGRKITYCVRCIAYSMVHPEVPMNQAVTVFNGAALCELHVKDSFDRLL